MRVGWGLQTGLLSLLISALWTSGHRIPPSVLQVGARDGGIRATPARFCWRDRLSRALRRREDGLDPPEPINRSHTIVEQPATSQERESLAHNPYARRSLVLAAAIHGGGIVALKMIHEFVKPEISLVLRFLFASLVFVPQLLRFDGGCTTFIAGLELGLWSFAGFLAQGLALQNASASKVSLFASLAVVFSSLFASMDPAQRTRSGKTSGLWAQARASGLISVALAVCGTVVLEWSGAEAPSRTHTLLLLSPLCFAVVTRRREAFAIRYPQHPEALTAVMVVCVACCSALWAVVSGHLPLSEVEWQDLGRDVVNEPWMLPLGLLLGVIGTAWTALTEQRALKIVPASEAAVVSALQPICASALAFLVLRERIAPNMALGAVLIVAACALGGGHVGDGKAE